MDSLEINNIIINKLHEHHFYSTDKLDTIESIIRDLHNNIITSASIDYNRSIVQVQFKKKNIKNFDKDTLDLYNEFHDVFMNFCNIYKVQLLSILGQEYYNYYVNNISMFIYIMRFNNTSFLINLI